MGFINYDAMRKKDGTIDRIQVVTLMTFFAVAVDIMGWVVWMNITREADRKWNGRYTVGVPTEIISWPTSRGRNYTLHFHYTVSGKAYRSTCDVSILDNRKELLSNRYYVRFSAADPMNGVLLKDKPARIEVVPPDVGWEQLPE